MKNNHPYSIQLGTYWYWGEKRQFQLPFDEYTSWVLAIVESGSFEYKINQVTGTAINGDIVICPPHTKFYRKVNSAALSFLFLNFQWRKENEESEIHFRKVIQANPSYKFRLKELDLFFHTFKRLHKLFDRYHPLIQKMTEHLINDLWLNYCLETEELEREQKILKDETMVAIKEIIEKKAFEKILLKELAAKAHLTKVQLTRRFYDTFGVKPMAFVTSVRIQKAKVLLIETNYTIDYIARLCGYDNGFYFSRVFSKHQQMTPSEYRKLHSV